MKLFKILGLVISLSFLYSCSVEQHLRLSKSHLQKAIAKGAKVESDTSWKYSYTKETIYDSVTHKYYEVLKKDSTIYIVTNNISVGMSRQDRKALDDYFDFLIKMQKLQNDSLAKELKAQVAINNSNNKTASNVSHNETKSPWAWSAVFISLAVIAVLAFAFIVLKKIGIL